MVELRRRELLGVVQLADELLDVASPADLRPVLLAGLARLNGGNAAIFHELDVREPVRVLAVGWPADRFTAGFAQRAAPVVHTHPMFEVNREWIGNGRRPPPVWRLSHYVGARQWRGTALYREALSDIDDQMIMMTGVRGSHMRCISIERSGGTFTDRDLEVFVQVARHVRAAVRRATAAAVPALHISPYPAWATIDPQPSVQTAVPLDL